MASQRSDRPFVTVNCAALPPELMESELFGYETGAFTGAKVGGVKGKFEMADTGTIFLDEIGELPLPMQAKLLRVLETGEIQKIAHKGQLHSDFRLTARPTEIWRRWSGGPVPRGSVPQAERFRTGYSASAGSRERHTPSRPAFRHPERRGQSPEGYPD